ncbi:MAG: hypothetical protein H8D47_03625, partial [Planctomycetes bacterium]|nr:hypothetical protein [Planctomycetota bacterium]
MTKDNFTKQQQTAICSTGSDMLVTASAGNGKNLGPSPRRPGNPPHKNTTDPERGGVGKRGKPRGRR